LLGWILVASVTEHLLPYEKPRLLERELRVNFVVCGKRCRARSRSQTSLNGWLVCFLA